jgi:membrane-associated phospholipid phosphatase
VTRDDLEERAASRQDLAPRPLLPPTARVPAIVALAICGVVTAVFGAMYAHQPRAGWLDARVDARVQSLLAGHSALLNGTALLGSPIPMIVMTAAMALACLVTRRWRGVLLVVIAVPLAAALTDWVLKPVIGRTLRGDLSFPSGHTTGVFAVAAVLTVLLTGPLRPRLAAPVRLLCVLAAFLAASATAAAMVGMGAHYFTDTVGGVAVAVGAVLATALAIDRFAPPGVQRKSVSAPIGSAASSSLRRVWR